MTPDAIDSLQRGLGLRLPAPYRDAMVRYPFGPDSSAAELWLLDDPTRLWELNRARSGAWPREYFALGTDGGELTYVLDTTAAPFPVLALDVESGKLEPHAPSFPAFVTHLREEMEAVETDTRTRAEAYQHKKWWQFWIQR